MTAVVYLDSSCVSSSSVHERLKLATKTVEQGGLLPGAGGTEETIP